MYFLPLLWQTGPGSAHLSTHTSHSACPLQLYLKAKLMTCASDWSRCPVCSCSAPEALTILNVKPQHVWMLLCSIICWNSLVVWSHPCPHTVKCLVLKSQRPAIETYAPFVPHQQSKDSRSPSMQSPCPGMSKPHSNPKFPGGIAANSSSSTELDRWHCSSDAAL